MNDREMVKKIQKDLEIEWFGVDGFLIVLYLAIVAVIFFALKTENDFIVGKFIPYSVMTAVSVIFLTYIKHVISFMAHHASERNDRA
jgi:hypothetical protein